MLLITKEVYVQADSDPRVQINGFSSECMPPGFNASVYVKASLWVVQPEACEKVEKLKFEQFGQVLIVDLPGLRFVVLR